MATLNHNNGVRSVAFSPDGTLLATGSDDNTAKVWVVIVPPAPVLSAPVDGIAFVDTLTPTLQWEVSERADSYNVQIATDDPFNTVVIEGSSLKATEWIVPTGKLTPGQQYFWRVNATGITGTGEWSKPWSFMVDAVNNCVAELAERVRD